MNRIGLLILYLLLFPVAASGTGAAPEALRRAIGPNGIIEDASTLWGLFPPSATRWQYTNQLGPQSVLVIPVYFSGSGEGTVQNRTVTELQGAFFGGPGTFSMAQWFDSNSGGQTTLNGATSLVTAWVQVPNTMAYYGGDNGNCEDHDLKYHEFVQDAINAAVPFVANFQNYNHLIVLHAAIDQAHDGTCTSPAKDRIWSKFVADEFTTPQGPKDGAAILASEDATLYASPISTWTHELLHSFGVPDFYGPARLDGQVWGNQSVGPWSVMGDHWQSFPDFGVGLVRYLAPAADPVVRHFLGWGPTPTIIGSSGTYSVYPSGPGANTLYRINIPTTQEAFFIEYRLFEKNGIAGIQTGEWDGPLGARSTPVQPGLVVWHIDQALIDNAKLGKPFNTEMNPSSTIKHFGVVVENPGVSRSPVNSNGEKLDAYDPDQRTNVTFSKDRLYTAFTPATAPNSNAYADVASNVFLTEISARPTLLTDPMTFKYDVRRYSGYPVASGASTNTSSPQLGDITGDGVNEVVLVANNKVSAYNKNGGLVAQFTLDGAASTIRTTPALVDLDNDGILDVVVAGYTTVYALKSIGGSFSTLWSKSYSTGVGTANASPAVGDIDGDGQPEVFLGSRTGCLYGWHRDGTQITTPASPCNLAFALTVVNDTLTATATVADIDNDGIKEIIQPSAGPTSPGVYLFTSTGAAYSGSWPVATLAMSASAAVGNLDGAGQKEIVVGTFAAGSSNFVRAYRPNATQYWNFNLGSDRLRASPALGDVNGDGVLDAVFGDNNNTFGRIHAVNGPPGADLPGFPYATNGFVFSSCALADMDADTVADILVGSNDVGNKVHGLTNKFVSPSWTVAPVAGWAASADVDAGCDASPAIGLISDQPTYGVFISTKNASTGNLYGISWCINFDGDKVKFPWTSFHHDRLNSGDYDQDTFPPPPPFPVNVFNVGNGTMMTVKWTPPEGAFASDVVGYDVILADNGVPPNTISVTDAGNREQLTIPGLTTNTTYNFSVRSYDNAKPRNKSAKAPWVPGTPTLSPFNTSVAGLAANNLGDGRSLGLSWNDPGLAPRDAQRPELLTHAGFVLEWDTASNPTEYKYTQDVGNVLAMTITDLTPGTTYYFNIVPYDVQKNLGVRTTEITGTPLNTLPPGPPTGLQARNVGDGTQLIVSWLANLEFDLAGYQLFVGTSPGVYGAPISLGAVTTYTLTGLTSGTTYYLALKAFDTVPNLGSYSREISLLASTAPAPPGGILALALGDGCSVDLRWAANTELDLGSYQVFSGTSPGTYGAPANNGLATNRTILGLTAGTTYYFAVKALDTGSNPSLYSLELSAKPVDIIKPANVGNTLTDFKSGSDVVLNWTAVTLNANGGTCENVTGYRVYRGTTPNFTPGAPIGNPVGVSFSDTGAASPGPDYFYLVSAMDAAGNESAKN